MTYWKCFRFLATLVVCGTQLGNYAVEIIQMTLESAWIYEIHHFQLKFESIYRKEVKIIAITYFLATLPILATKIAFTRYLLFTCYFEIAGRWSKSRIFENCTDYKGYYIIFMDQNIISYWFICI